MTTREQLDARLAEFDRRSADAQSRTQAVHEAWERDRHSFDVLFPAPRLRELFRFGSRAVAAA